MNDDAASWRRASTPPGADPAPAVLPAGVVPSVEQVQAQLAGAERQLANERMSQHHPWCRGIAATCRWILGQAAAPVEAPAGAITAGTLAAVAERAEWLLYHPSQATRPQGYYQGVEYTTYWLTGRNTDPPL